MKTQVAWVLDWHGSGAQGVGNYGQGQVGCTACAKLVSIKGTVCTGTWANGGVVPRCSALRMYVLCMGGMGWRPMACPWLSMSLRAHGAWAHG